MSYKFSFADNEVYTATDVNNITKRLVTAGVADTGVFENGVAYNVSKLNEAGKILYTSGVVGEDCNTLKVTKVNDSEILINPGTAFFEDGAVIEIEAGGETMSFIPNSKNYVYLKNELADENRCYPVVSVKEPTGDSVLLAEIGVNGEVTDKRVYARGKLPGYQSLGREPLYFKETMKVTFKDKNNASGSAEFDIGNNSYQYIVFTNSINDGKCSPYLSNVGKDLVTLSLYRISDGSAISFCEYSESSGSISDDSGTIWTYYVDNGYGRAQHKMTVSFTNGILKVNAYASYYDTYQRTPGDEVLIGLNMIFI